MEKQENEEKLSEAEFWKQAYIREHDARIEEIKMNQTEKRGRWKNGCCSTCGFFIDIQNEKAFRFCPGCGAKMDEQIGLIGHRKKEY